MKHMIFACFLSLAACSSGSSSGEGATVGLSDVKAPEQPASVAQPTVRMSQNTWEVKSALGIQSSGILTVFFSPDAGVGCDRFHGLSQTTQFVTFMVPVKAASYDLRNSLDFARNQISGAFSEGRTAVYPMDQLRLEISGLKDGHVKGSIRGLGSSNQEISGDFQVQICKTPGAEG